MHRVVPTLHIASRVLASLAVLVALLEGSSCLQSSWASPALIPVPLERNSSRTESQAR